MKHWNKKSPSRQPKYS